MNNIEPDIKVGILFSPLIEFNLKGQYRNVDSGDIITGKGRISLKAQSCVFLLNGVIQSCELPLELEPLNIEESSFELLNVTIGINFHWERKENQKFKGRLKIIKEEKHLIAINILPLESYLLSVISSEMSANSSLELLKAHSVISRSWILAQINKSFNREKIKHSLFIDNEKERIRWYDREDHYNFDVCADDHCQRYQGITKVTKPKVKEAVETTKGQVLTYENIICDTRYSKCCGGKTEHYENVWEPVSFPYLTKVIDAHGITDELNVDLRNEEEAKKWMLTKPACYCNTSDQSILKQVLNDYDLETKDFFRWKVLLPQKKLCSLLKQKTNIELGEILDLVPLERGVSGRIIRIRIDGTEGSFILGKELEIRKAFSTSHLYSSAFIVEKGKITNKIPEYFILHGAGWGHGVGLCQIGAAVMGAQGFSYKEILSHYFVGAELTKKY